MKFTALASLFGLTALAACTLPGSEPQGGANINERTNGGEQGEALLTGAMIVSPDGRFVLAQRNQTTVLLDVEAGKARELPEQVERFVFSKSGEFGLAVLPARAGVVRYDLRTLTPKWRVVPAFKSGGGARLARLSTDEKSLVLGDDDRVLVLDATSGDVRGAVPLGTPATELTFVPGTNRALVVGSTTWRDHAPNTAVVDFDLATLAEKAITVPNCTAPVLVLPDGSRGFLSPTFCEEGRASNATQTWTNPDPVSVIDLAPSGPAFVKNLPGFGPVVSDEGGSRIVAYLDMKRIDESMFDDKAQIPAKSGAQFHIMTIEPRSLAFTLTPVGNVLPRFAMAKSGRQLLVDATVQNVRGEASVKATIDTSGRITVSFSVFGQQDSLFGAFDLDAKKYTPFSGDAARLDRFVQMGDGQRVFSLAASWDGMGGELHRVDLDAHRSTDLGKSLRDLGVLADGKTLVLRERLPALRVDASGGIEWYRREQFCFSLDGVSCLRTVVHQDSVPFQRGPTCAESHDC